MVTLMPLIVAIQENSADSTIMQINKYVWSLVIQFQLHWNILAPPGDLHLSTLEMFSIHSN